MTKDCAFITKEGTPCQNRAVRAVVEPAGTGHLVRAYCTLHSKEVAGDIYRRTGRDPVAYRV